MITAQPEFNRIPQRGAADHLNLSAVTETHLQQSPPQFRIASDTDDASLAPNPQLVEPAGFRLSRMIARGKIASLFHGLVSRSLGWMLPGRSYHIWLRLSFNNKLSTYLKSAHEFPYPDAVKRLIHDKMLLYNAYAAFAGSRKCYYRTAARHQKTSRLTDALADLNIRMYFGFERKLKDQIATIGNDKC